MPNNSNPSAPVVRVLSHFDMVKPSTNGWMVRCPAHDDKTPSLSIKQGDDGKALLKCFAGCTVEAITHALGLRLFELMPERDSLNESASTSHRSKPTKAARGFPMGRDAMAAYRTYLGAEASRFTYRDAKGTPIGIVARWNNEHGGKEYRPAFLIDGKWQHTYPKIRPLYALDKLAAAQKSQPVYLAEGEKCADLLASLGFLATTAPQGSSGAALVDLMPLAGFEVIIVPDADNAGETYAATIQTRLRQLAIPPARTLVLHLPAARADSGDDVEQFINDRHKGDLAAATDQLHELACIALEGAPPLRVPTPKMQTALDLMRADDFHEPPHVMKAGWIPFDSVQPFGGLERGTLTVLSAPPGCHKTNVMLRLARGFASNGRGVRWLAGEMRPQQLAKRIVAQAAGLPLAALWLKGCSYEAKVNAAERRLEGALSAMQIVRAPIGLEEIRSAAAEADVVFIDYLQLVRHPDAAMARHEQLQQIMDTCIEACQTSGAVFILASAQARGGGVERDISTAFKGSSAIEYSADVCYCATAPTKEELQSNQYPLHFANIKQREGPQLEFEVAITGGQVALEDAERELNDDVL